MTARDAMPGLFANFLRRVPFLGELAAHHPLRLVRCQQLLIDAELEERLRDLKAQDRYRDPRGLTRHEGRVYSQAGEDGTIAEVFRRIGEGGKRFLELGVGDGYENNTALLLHQGWTGAWIDGDKRSVELIRRRFRRPLSDGRLALRQSFVTAENVEATVRQLGVEPGVDLLSLDMDLNTYWIWQALAFLKPRVAVVEYNAFFGAEVDWKAEYRPGEWWGGTTYFGASLKAVERLGSRLGFHLVGCSLSGCNAFFVAQPECGDRFLAPYTAENHYEPYRVWVCHRSGHPKSFDGEA